MSDERLIAVLRHAAFTASAHHDAVYFIATVVDGKHVFQSADAVEAEIALVRALSPLPTAGQHPTSSHVYRQAYMSRLRQLQPELATPTPELYRQRYTTEGYRNALHMAFSNHGNVDTLLRAMERSDYTWQMQTEAQPESAVQRRYAEGYRQGLQDAVNVIESDDASLVAYAPDWFEAKALPQLNQLLSVRHQYDAAQAAYTILQQSEGDMWCLQRNIERHQQWQQRVQQAGDQTMEAYVRDVIIWLEQGRDILAACVDLS